MRSAVAVLLTAGAVLASAADAFADGSGLTAAISPDGAIVGATKVAITGTAEPGHEIVDTSTFPDGSVHRFSAKADQSGAYVDGPFVLEQLGPYRDVLSDEATGTSTTLSYSGVGDFGATVEPAEQTVAAGSEANFTLVFSGISGFAGRVRALLSNLPDVPGAAASWSATEVKVPADGSASAILTVFTLITTPPGTYDLALAGSNGAVSHRLPPVRLTVVGPDPNAITAAVHPENAVVGRTEIVIRGTASAGDWVTDTSTFPDGSVHQFSVKATGSGSYVDGPFLLRQLGIYHDVLTDGATGATVTVTYRGAGDFSAAVDGAKRTVTAGRDTDFLVTFKSLGGFRGKITPEVANLPDLPGATAVWSAPSVTLKSGGEGASRLHLMTAADTPPGTYKLTLQGTNGSVTRAPAPAITVTVRPR